MEDIGEKHIVSFSGGKDSTAMLLLMIEKGMKIDEIIFCDTGMEFPEMYEHIKKVEDHTKRKITILKSEETFEYYMFEHEIKHRDKKNDGVLGYGFPRMTNRWCTIKLKQQLFERYIKEKYKGLTVVRYIGIAFDELNRVKEYEYPLVSWGVTEKQALKYCYDKGFDWNGLYEKFDRLSCWCCPLQRLSELEILYIEYPDLWNKLKVWQSKTYNLFRPDYTLDELELRFGVLNDFKKVLNEYDLNCTNKIKKAIVNDLKKEMFKVVTD